MSINYIPIEVCEKVFEYLSFTDYRSAKEVSHLWNSIIKRLVNQNIKVFGVQKWKEYYNLTIDGEIPALPPNTLEILQPEHSDVSKRVPVSIILVPKGIRFDKLEEILDNPCNLNKKGEIKSLFSRNCVNRFGDAPIKKNYWVAITDAVIEESRGIGLIAQRCLISRVMGPSWDAPKLIEIVISCFMNYNRSGQHLLGSSPLTYTNVQESIDTYPLVVGNFEQGALTINNRFGNYTCYAVTARRELV